MSTTSDPIWDSGWITLRPPTGRLLRPDDWAWEYRLIDPLTRCLDHFDGWYYRRQYLALVVEEICATNGPGYWQIPDEPGRCLRVQSWGYTTPRGRQTTVSTRWTLYPDWPHVAVCHDGWLLSRWAGSLWEVCGPEIAVDPRAAIAPYPGFRGANPVDSLIRSIHDHDRPDAATIAAAADWYTERGDELRADHCLRALARAYAMGPLAGQIEYDPAPRRIHPETGSSHCRPGLWG